MSYKEDLFNRLKGSTYCIGFLKSASEQSEDAFELALRDVVAANKAGLQPAYLRLEDAASFVGMSPSMLMKLVAENHQRPMRAVWRRSPSAVDGQRPGANLLDTLGQRAYTRSMSSEAGLSPKQAFLCFSVLVFCLGLIVWSNRSPSTESAGYTKADAIRSVDPYAFQCYELYKETGVVYTALINDQMRTCKDKGLYHDWEWDGHQLTVR